MANGEENKNPLFSINNTKKERVPVSSTESVTPTTGIPNQEQVQSNTEGLFSIKAPEVKKKDQTQQSEVLPSVLE